MGSEWKKTMLGKAFEVNPFLVRSSGIRSRHLFRWMSGSLYQQIADNERQSRTLAQLRDTLLPKLISGELRVADAEAFLRERGL